MSTKSGSSGGGDSGGGSWAKIVGSGPTPPPKPRTFRAITKTTSTPYKRMFQDSIDRAHSPRTRSYSFGELESSTSVSVDYSTLKSIPGTEMVSHKRVNRVHTHDRSEGIGVTRKPVVIGSTEVGSSVDEGAAKRTEVVGSVIGRRTYGLTSDG